MVCGNIYHLTIPWWCCLMSVVMRYASCESFLVMLLDCVLFLACQRARLPFEAEKSSVCVDVLTDIMFISVSYRTHKFIRHLQNDQWATWSSYSSLMVNISNDLSFLISFHRETVFYLLISLILISIVLYLSIVFNFLRLVITQL